MSHSVNTSRAHSTTSSNVLVGPNERQRLACESTVRMVFLLLWCSASSPGLADLEQRAQQEDNATKLQHRRLGESV